MKLSVIIVNYNVRYFLEQCLRSVLNAGKQIEMEVLVVDNNSVDGSVEMLKEKFPEVLLIGNSQNMGFSKANNQAIKQSKGEYVLLLNPDTVVENDTFEKIIAFMDAHPEAGGLGVKMVDGKGDFLPESKRGLPTPAVAFYKIFGLSALFPKSKKFGKYHLGFLDKDKTHEVDVLSGAFMLIRQETLQKTGLLDEDFFMYGEDIDLSYRITQAGYKNYYFPETRIIHYKGESTKKSSINYVFVFYRAMAIFAKKHFSEKHARLFSLLINVAVWFRASVAVVSHSVKKALLPMVDFSVILTGLYFLRTYYTVQTGIAYANELVNVAFPIYSMVWLFGILLSGGYRKPINIQKVVTGLLIGTGIILAVYALLNEDYRFSRALILFGAAWTAISVLAVRLALHFAGIKGFRIGKKLKKRLAIVGDEEERIRVSKLMNQTHLNIEFIANVHPDNRTEAESSNFIACLHQLKEVIGIFRINEVIFCAKSIPANEIINQMSLIALPEVQYKIAPPESMYIIGSDSIETAGELYYMMDINSINKSSNKRKKRGLDIILSVLFLLTFPLMGFIVKRPFFFLNNIFAVLRGKISWVGYAANGQSALPQIRNGILHPAGSNNKQEIDKDAAKQLNLIYARNYQILHDLKIIFRGLEKLGESPLERDYASNS